MNDRRRGYRGLLIALTLVLTSGCGGTEKKETPTSYQFPLKVEVTDTEGEPIPGAPVQLAGTTFGYTDSDGKFVGTLTDRPGKTIPLSVGEVDGYRYVDEHSTEETLETKRKVSGKGRKGVPILLHAVAESTRENYLIWVRTTCDEETMEAADCRNLPIRHNGETIARTDASGNAHLTLRERPGEKMHLTVDTPDPPSEEEEDEEIPTYRPADPGYSVAFDLDHRVYIITADFEDPDAAEDSGGGRVYHPPPDPDPGGGGSSGAGGSGGGSDDSAQGGSGGGGDDKKGGDDGVIELF